MPFETGLEICFFAMEFGVNNDLIQDFNFGLNSYGWLVILEIRSKCDLCLGCIISSAGDAKSSITKGWLLSFRFASSIDTVRKKEWKKSLIFTSDYSESSCPTYKFHLMRLLWARFPKSLWAEKSSFRIYLLEGSSHFSIQESICPEGF